MAAAKKTVCQSCWEEFDPLSAAEKLCPKCAPPSESSFDELVAEPIWRHQRDLVMEKFEPVLPDACLKCNTPTEERMRRKFYWHHPALYLTLLLGVLPYVIVAIAVRKEAVVFLPVCREHRARRRNLITAGWLLFVGAVALFIVGGTTGNDLFAWTALLLLVCSIVVAVMVGRTFVWPVRIDRELIHLRGAGPEFLARFPDWAGRRP